MSIYRDSAMHPNKSAFLSMVGWSEGTTTIKASDDGYNVIVGGSLFHEYSDHPRVLVDLPRLGIKSTAAGRYQILSRYYDHYKKQLGLPDFSPESQDKIALQLINECHATDDIVEGRIADAITKCASRWASFPSAGYGQREHEISVLIEKFVEFGGTLAGADPTSWYDEVQKK